MSMEIPHSFSRFRMTDAEVLASSTLTVMQRQHIHNLRVEVAEFMLNIEDDLDKPLAHVKERARLQGLLQAYAGLISDSDAAETVIAALAQSDQR